MIRICGSRPAQISDHESVTSIRGLNGIWSLVSESTTASAFFLPPTDCPADLDDDGSIGVTDLVALLLNWGTDGPGATLASPFGVIDVVDLVELILQWGVCP